MRQPARDDGITLIEVLVTIALMGALMAIAIGGYRHWAEADEQQGTARQLQSVLRATQQRAVTEGRTLCVKFASGDYEVWSASCSTASGGTQIEGPIPTQGSAVELASPSFQDPSGAGTLPTLTFFTRGTATAGSVQVIRTGSAKVYTVTVEELTGRVSLD